MAAGFNSGFSVDGLDQYLAWLKSLEANHIEKMLDRIVRTAAMRYLEYAQDLTPRRTSRLAGSLSAGGVDNVFKVWVSNKVAQAIAGTAVEYARYVEEGFTQKRGQFVPGEWKSGTFHYVPYTPGSGVGGMVLTGKKIEGAYMFSKAFDRLEEDMPDIILFEVKRLWDELGG
jgi:hypothetical protein